MAAGLVEPIAGVIAAKVHKSNKKGKITYLNNLRDHIGIRHQHLNNRAPQQGSTTSLLKKIEINYLVLGKTRIAVAGMTGIHYCRLKLYDVISKRKNEIGSTTTTPYSTTNAYSRR